MASENIGAIVGGRSKYDINDAMVTNAPSRNWQDVWLRGLCDLQERNVYVVSNSKVFFEKFKRTSSRMMNKSACFNPDYKLPEGQKSARCILDWERKQIVRCAQTN